MTVQPIHLQKQLLSYMHSIFPGADIVYTTSVESKSTAFLVTINTKGETFTLRPPRYFFLGEITVSSKLLSFKLVVLDECISSVLAN